MSLMHSERLEEQALSVKLFQKLGLEDNLKFAKHHRDIVKKFGRFPHRNTLLGRKNTVADTQYLASKEAFTG
ncbi:hypothetical protein [uncultured Gammaproteobacteria bacterium]|nr:hypothetical protein [uncultured Gammaproteobacteria bacterium]CAC9952872.1 hypothetical protein [uncultured Gammaproteobacteria bacterium]CAC9965466.1 hypothetical protein [uncultured Gammaproteobacteria bacterium]SHN90218.1 hypothetical protein BHECKSOX_401 [Bathymodiolus heckerae thiotrophic gill symbiont]